MFTPPNVSHVTCHVARGTCHVSRATCHVSRVTCHVSHVTYQKKKLTFNFLFFYVKKIGQIGGASSVEGLLSTGPTPSSFLKLHRAALGVILQFKFFQTLSIPNRKSKGAEILREFSSYTICDLSCITCHLSPVTCHLSPVTCIFV